MRVRDAYFPSSFHWLSLSPSLKASCYQQSLTTCTHTSTPPFMTRHYSNNLQNQARPWASGYCIQSNCEHPTDSASPLSPPSQSTWPHIHHFNFLTKHPLTSRHSPHTTKSKQRPLCHPFLPQPFNLHHSLAVMSAKDCAVEGL